MSKARVHETSGMPIFLSQSAVSKLNISKDFIHSVMVDETYQLVASHVGEITQEKIVRGDYVDFGRLVPKDRILTADDNWYEMIVKEGKTFWIPAGQNDSTAISNYGRWEQAFRVFSDIYMRAHPTRASELVQYNHLIHDDKDFRIHLAKFPNRSWAIILQQAWSVRLR